MGIGYSDRFEKFRKRNNNDFLFLLTSNRPEAAEISNWLTVRAREEIALDSMTALESELLRLSFFVQHFNELAHWERLSQKQRVLFEKSLSRSVDALIEILQNAARPPIPPALELFSEERAFDIADSMRSGLRESLLLCTEFSTSKQPAFFRASGEPVYLPLAGELSSHFSFPEPQTIVDLLRGLQKHVRRASVSFVSRSKRPNTGDSNRRLFACELASYFGENFDLHPNGIIAACVNLKYPDESSPASEDMVRTWRGVR